MITCNGGHTSRNSSNAGGQEQGIWIGRPFVPFTAPAQLPVPIRVINQDQQTHGKNRTQHTSGINPRHPLKCRNEGGIDIASPQRQ